MTDLLPDQVPPQQKTFGGPKDNDMYAKITCTPPLGQASVVPRDNGFVRFTVLLETGSSSTSELVKLLNLDE